MSWTFRRCVAREAVARRGAAPRRKLRLTPLLPSVRSHCRANFAAGQFVAHYHDLLAQTAPDPGAALTARREGTTAYFEAYLAGTNTSVKDSAAIREAHTMAGATRVLYRGPWQGYSSATPVTRLALLELCAHPSMEEAMKL